MNFFNIINACLAEMNYKRADLFENLVGSDHTRIKTIVNRTNSDVVLSADWWFRQKREQVIVQPAVTEIALPVNGRIASLYVDGKEYRYTDNYGSFYNGTAPRGCYSLYGGSLLLGNFDVAKTVQVFYYTHSTATGADGSEKVCMTMENDCSLIPAAYVEPLLVYGSCMRFKASPQNPKFAYWNAQYVSALSNLRSQGARSGAEGPNIVIKA